MPLIQKRYAEALINVCSEQNLVDKIQAELDEISQLLDSNTEFRKFIDTPKISLNEKKEIIEKVFNTQLDKISVNFLKLLIDKGRMGYFKEIVREYMVLADEMRSVLNIEVTTAINIEEEQLNKIASKYKAQYKSKDVKIKHIVDSSIIGGVIVRIGGKLIDSSIKGRLSGMLEVICN